MKVGLKICCFLQAGKLQGQPPLSDRAAFPLLPQGLKRDGRVR
jgi:hypothetical protein